VIDVTQKETALDQKQHSCETLICQRHQTILRPLSSVAMASTRWQVRELCPTTYCMHIVRHDLYPLDINLSIAEHNSYQSCIRVVSSDDGQVISET
jgi:hypothetical protein